VTHLPGRGLLIPKNVFCRIGLFNENDFPHYLADYDFTHRAFTAGFELFCNFDSILYVYPNESGDKLNRKKRNLKNFINHITAINGGGNLWIFTQYVRKNCPSNYKLTFWLKGALQRVLGFWIKQYEIN